MASGSRQAPAACAATSARLRADNTRRSGTQAACSALPAGRMSVAPGASRATPSAMTSGAATGTSAPVNDSSPASTRSASAGAGARASGAPSAWAANCPDASNTPRAMGRSKRPDSLGRSAGERLTVMRPGGNSKPLLRMAARTRSRLSRTSVSGKPTTLKPGSPGPRCVSTRTAWVSRPQRARLARTASVKAVSRDGRKPPVSAKNARLPPRQGQKRPAPAARAKENGRSWRPWKTELGRPPRGRRHAYLSSADRRDSSCWTWAAS
ncbi:hypothetical protein LMG1860_05341 [Achromobacter denitrificans]|nr:hypothetical protein LMG1860_05341 [Achromobacter denitrificans]